MVIQTFCFMFIEQIGTIYKVDSQVVTDSHNNVRRKALLCLLVCILYQYSKSHLYHTFGTIFFLYYFLSLVLLQFVLFRQSCSTFQPPSFYKFWEIWAVHWLKTYCVYLQFLFIHYFQHSTPFGNIVCILSINHCQLLIYLLWFVIIQ